MSDRAPHLVRALRNAWWRWKLRAWVRFADRHRLWLNVTPRYCDEFREYDAFEELRRWVTKYLRA